jgi:hypothetical protein
MQKEIKYIGFYENPLGKSKRNQALSATNKMDYIATALYEAGIKVHMVSPSWMLNDKAQPVYEKTTTNKVLSWKKVTAVSSWRTSTKLGGYFKILWSLIWLFGFLLKNVKKGEKILVYHSPWLALPIILAKKIKHFHLILEVEEIYSDVSSLHPYFDKLEQRIFKVADSFLFSTDLLPDKINTNKNFTVIYGNYQTFETFESPFIDGKIHLVYAGIIDSHKAGAFNAIESALYLNENYVMHIIGFGQVELLKSRIEEINKTSKCKVIFDGTKYGNEFIKYCQQCHIGLSTQKMDGAYLDTSFPSKILSYLGMGLRVVSCYVSCVAKSEIGDQVFYYMEDTPYAIAQSILNIDIKKLNDPREKLKELHVEFVNELKKELSNE